MPESDDVTLAARPDFRWGLYDSGLDYIVCKSVCKSERDGSKDNTTRGRTGVATGQCYLVVAKISQSRRSILLEFDLFLQLLAATPTANQRRAFGFVFILSRSYD